MAQPLVVDKPNVDVHIKGLARDAIDHSLSSILHEARLLQHFTEFLSPVRGLALLAALEGSRVNKLPTDSAGFAGQ